MIQKDLSWKSLRRLPGGLIMFGIEALIVSGLAIVALVLASVILAIL